MRFSIIIVLSSLVALTVQECCGFAVVRSGCCGNGPCNIFCCNCDNSCDSACMEEASRRADDARGLFGAVEKRKRSAVADNQAQLRFISIDTNGDGLITEEEGRDFMLNGTSSERVKRTIGSDWFAEIDTNGDGFIQPGEFDYSLI